MANLLICGVDEAAAGALQTLREARASKRARHAAGADSDAAATHGANAARNDGVDGACLHCAVDGAPARLGRVLRLGTPSPPLAFFAAEGADDAAAISDDARTAGTHLPPASLPATNSKSASLMCRRSSYFGEDGRRDALHGLMEVAHLSLTATLRLDI